MLESRLTIVPNRWWAITTRRKGHLIPFRLNICKFIIACLGRWVSLILSAERFCLWGILQSSICECHMPMLESAMFGCHEQTTDRFVMMILRALEADFCMKACVRDSFAWFVDRFLSFPTSLYGKPAWAYCPKPGLTIGRRTGQSILADARAANMWCCNWGNFQMIVIRFARFSRSDMSPTHGDTYPMSM